MLISGSILIVINTGILEGLSFWGLHCPFVSAVVREAVVSGSTKAAGEAVKRANTKHMFGALARYQRRDNDVNGTVSLCAYSWEWRTPFRCSLSCLAMLNLPIAIHYSERLSAWPRQGARVFWGHGTSIDGFHVSFTLRIRQMPTKAATLNINMQGRRCADPVMGSIFLGYSRWNYVYVLCYDNYVYLNQNLFH